MTEFPILPQTGLLDGSCHLLPVRVYYEDTDFSGLVYHASYLRFLERGRTELLRATGIDQQALHVRNDCAFAVRRMTIDYVRPAHMDDALIVRTGIAQLRGSTLGLSQAIHRGDEILLTASVLVVCLRSGRPIRIPDDVRQTFSRIEAGKLGA